MERNFNVLNGNAYTRALVPIVTVEYISLKRKSISPADVQNDASKWGSVKRIKVVNEGEHHHAIVTYDSTINGNLLKKDLDSKQSTSTNGERVLLRKRRYQLESIDDEPMPAKCAKTTATHLLTDLNDDCWLEIFSILDLLALSIVAKCNIRFKTLAHNVFRRVNRNLIHVIFGVQPWLSLVDLKQILQEFGPYTKGLRLKSSKSLKLLSVDYTTKLVCNMIAQYLDLKLLRYLRIKLWPLQSKHIVELRALFKRFSDISELYLDMGNNPNTIEIGDLTHCLPNLLYLFVYGDVIVKQISWPSLKSLQIIRNYTITRRQLNSMLSLNPQIKTFGTRRCPLYDSMNQTIDDLVALGLHQKLTALSFDDCALRPYAFSGNIALFQLLNSLIIDSLSFDPSVANANLIAKLINLKDLVLLRRENRRMPGSVELKQQFLQILGGGLINLKFVAVHGFNIDECDWENFVALLPKCIYNVMTISTPLIIHLFKETTS